MARTQPSEISLKIVELAKQDKTGPEIMEALKVSRQKMYDAVKNHGDGIKIRRSEYRSQQPKKTVRCAPKTPTYAAVPVQPPKPQLQAQQMSLIIGSHEQIAAVLLSMKGS